MPVAEDAERSTCPRCGEPARRVLLEAVVSRDTHQGERVQLWKVLRVIGYVCGGGHDWAPPREEG